MSYAKSFLSRIHDLHRYPPLIFFRKLHAICIELDAMDAFDAQAEEQIALCFIAIILKLPDQFRMTLPEFLAEGQRWMADEGAYNRGPTIPLHDLLPVAECILHIHSFFCDGPIRDLGLFAQMRRQLFLNQASYHRVSVVDVQRGRAPLVTDVDEEPEDLVAQFLGGTPFYHLFQIQVPYKIPMKTFASHGIILAPPNHGKTQLLGSLISGFLKDDDTPGLFVLDPHGDLYNVLRQRIGSDRLVALDPDTNPPPLNFFDFGNSTEAQTLQTFSYLMSSLSGGMSDKQGAIVPYLLKLLRRIPDASLETLRLVVDEKVKSPNASVFASAIAALPTVDQGFFHNQFYSSRMQETKDAIGWKLYAVLSNNTFREMFSAKRNSFDAWEAMQQRKVVLVKGSENTLGEAGAPIFLQFIVAQAMQASFRRAALPNDEEHRPLCLLIIDEAKHVFNDQTERILTECRKWNLGFLAATQLISQIPENVRTAIYGATAIKISGPVASSDASQLAREMYTTPDFIRGMKAKERSHADWAFYVNQMTDKAAKVRVPYGTLEKMPVVNPRGEGMSFDLEDDQEEENPFARYTDEYMDGRRRGRNARRPEQARAFTHPCTKTSQS
jgi:hypothetical protein